MAKRKSHKKSSSMKHTYYIRWYEKKFGHKPGTKRKHHKGKKTHYKLSSVKKKQYYQKWYKKKFGHLPGKGKRKHRR